MAARRFSFHLEQLEAAESTGLVFSDPRQRRRKRLNLLGGAAAALVLAWIALFLSDAISIARLKEEFTRFYGGSASEAATTRPQWDIAADQPQPELLQVALSPVEQSAQPCEAASPPPFSAMADETGTSRFMAHIPLEYEAAPLSVQDSCYSLETLVPEWLMLQMQGDQIKVKLVSADTRSAIADYSAGAAVRPRLMPVVRLDAGPETSAALDNLTAGENREQVITGLLRAALGLDAQGACFGFSQLRDDELRTLEPFFAEVQEEFSRAGLETCVILPAGGTLWRDPAMTSGFDTIVLKLFRETWTGTAAGPLASLDWFRETASEARELIGPDRLVAAVGAFAVDWTSGRPLPEKIPFAEAMQRISAAGGEVHFDPQVSNSFSTFRDTSGKLHKIWMIDAVSLHNQLAVLKDLGLPGTAIWSLGSEDPGIWDVLRHDGVGFDRLAAGLSVVNLKNFVHYEGDGAFLKIREPAAVGMRNVELDPATGLVSGQSYSTLPSPYSVEKYGRPESHKLVLTFDDGPEPEYTVPILDSLKSAGVPATFFVLGSRVMGAQDIVERMVREGHEIGAHSFSHPHMDTLSSVRSELEFSLAQKAIAGASGHETLLYREPFQRTGGPIRAGRVRTLAQAQDQGLILAGMEITPKDWEGWTARQIAEHVISEVEAGAGNVILLHDGGQDRTATVAAVPVIIAELQARGYEFTTLADLLGMTRAQLMPKADGAAAALDSLSFSAIAGTQDLLVIAFWTVLSIGIFRSIFIMVLSFIRRPNRPVALDRAPKVSIIIPAFNEEKVIAASIKSALASDYPNFEVVVVDDGSEDRTINEILRFSHKQNIRVISQPNQGKWSALNRAILQLDSEIAVCLDADTQMEPDAVSRLVRHFSNPKVGAVAGKIIVGNRVNLLTRLQALEYATSQNAERMAFDLMNGILVVPGAIGAWRVQALRDAGLYRSDTLTEDSDLTISVNRCGYRIVYDETARAWTEAPKTVRQLLAQRLRWSLGMFQSSWKHKRAFLEGRSVGTVSIPDMLIFGYLFPILAPVADIFFLTLVWNYLQGGADSVTQGVFWAYCALPLMELLLAASALLRDEDESPWSLLLFPLQRIFYRPLLYYSVIRSILRALSGRLASWGKQERQGRVSGVPLIGE